MSTAGDVQRRAESFKRWWAQPRSKHEFVLERFSLLQNEAYERLRTLEVARRRIALVSNDSKCSGGYSHCARTKVPSSVAWLPTLDRICRILESLSLQVAIGALGRLRRLQRFPHDGRDLYLIGSSLTIQDNEKEAIPFLKKALEIVRTHGDDVGAVQCLERIGDVDKRDSEYQDASSALENAAEMACRCGDRLGEAKALLVIVSVYQNENDRGASTISEA
ncbi:hypothetical protein FS837_006223, partial [Tulasnella sp. UAMH 9824]